MRHNSSIPDTANQLDARNANMLQLYLGDPGTTPVNSFGGALNKMSHHDSLMLGICSQGVSAEVF